MSEQEIYDYQILVERVGAAIVAHLNGIHNGRAVTENAVITEVTSRLGCSASLVEETIDDLRGKIELRVHDGEVWLRGLSPTRKFSPRRVSARIPQFA